MNTPFPLTLQWTRTLSPGVKHFSFSTPTTFSFIPGQFIKLYFPYQGQTLRRSYSIASTSTQTSQIELAASYVPGGKASEWLFNSQPGATVLATGPFGQFILPESHPKRYVLIGTATGITPYRSMLPTLAQLTQQGTEVVIVQGVRLREDALYLDDFLAIQSPHFQFLLYYSRDPLYTAQPYEHKGYVQASFPQLQLSPTQDLVYLCGNPHMIDDTFQQLHNLGFVPYTIKREKYVSPQSPPNIDDNTVHTRILA